MAFFDWKEEYSVNIKEIDKQHQKLVEMLNSLYDALKKGEGLEALGSTLSELISYTKTHFTTEERLMKTHGYPDYLSHKDKHEKMTNKVLDYVKKYEADGIRSPIEISNFLKDWLKMHIMQTDMCYSTFLNDKGVH
jgi:hemerythrin